VTLRPKPVWRFGLPAMLVVSLASAIAQQEWSALGGGILLWGGFGAMAWRWRLKVSDGHLRITRLRTIDFEVDRVVSAIEFVGSAGPGRHLRIWDPTRPKRHATLLLFWWDGWRELAAVLPRDVQLEVGD